MTDNRPVKTISWLTVAAAVLAFCSVAAGAGTPTQPSAVTGAGTPTQPSAVTGSASAVSQTAATLKATVDPEGQAATYYFEYGSTSSLGTETTQQSAGSGTTGVGVDTVLSGLTPATVYYYRIVATNATGMDAGAVRSFSTSKSLAATAKTEAASAVSATGATLNAAVDAEGQQTSFYFQYGSSSTALSTNTPQQSAGAGSADAHVDTVIGGLKASTTYYYRAVASNSSGTNNGDIKSFKTSGLSSPTAKTEAASALSSSGATLNGEVNPRGQATTYYFEYGTTSAFGTNTPQQSAGAGSSAVKVNAPLTGLVADTTYYYRLVASSPGGQDTASTKTFRTALVPLSLSVNGSPNPAPDGSDVQITGTLSGSEAANHEVVLEINPFPYSGGFQAVGSPALTSSSGMFSFVDRDVQKSAQIRVVTVGSSAVMSSVIQEEVSVAVSLHAQRTHKRNYVRLSGSVSPTKAGAGVIFQLVKGSSSTEVRVGSTTASGGGSFSKVIHVSHTGHYRALVEASGENSSGYSNAVLLTAHRTPHQHHHRRSHH